MKKLIWIICFLLISVSAFADTIYLTDFTDGWPMQRVGTSKLVTITGTYSGSPTSIQARIVQAGTSTEVVTWTTIVSSPSGNTFSGTLSVPQGNGVWYNVQVRYGNSTGVVSNGTNSWGVGVDFIVNGQSNSALGWYLPSSNGTDSGTPNSLCRVKYAVTTGSDGDVFDYTGASAWVVPQYSAAIAFCNAMATQLNMPIGLILYGYGASALSSGCEVGGYGHWLGTNSNCWSTLSPVITAIGGKVEGDIFLQAEEEAEANCAVSSYSGYLLSYFTQVRTNTSATYIVVAGLNGCTWYGSHYAEIRTQQQTAVNTDSGNGNKTAYVDMSDLNIGNTSDYIHYSASNNVIVGQRLAAALLAMYPAPTYTISGTVSGATQSGVTVACTGQTSTTTASDGTYSFTGLSAGSYTITPSKTGYTFSPTSLSETVTSSNITGADFTASAVTTGTQFFPWKYK